MAYLSDSENPLRYCEPKIAMILPLIALVFPESYKTGHHPSELLSSSLLPFHRFCQSDSQFPVKIFRIKK